MEKVPENRNSGTIFFSVKRKFPEGCPGIRDRCPGITNRYGNFPENRSGNFRFPEQLVP